MNNVKIAFVSDDGKIISAHFGRAQYYEVIEVEDTFVKSVEKRDKPFHTHTNRHTNHSHEHHTNDLNETRGKIHLMIDKIRDCQIVVARGMGQGAYNNLSAAGLKVIITDYKLIDEVLEEIKRGTIQNHLEKLH